MKDEGYYTLIEMKDEISEAGEPVPIRRRTLYPAELWVRMKDEGYYTLIEMKDEFSEAGEPVPIRSSHRKQS